MTLLEYRGNLYLPVSKAGEAAGFFSGPPEIDSLRAAYAGTAGTWEFQNGGDRLKAPDGTILALEFPLLVQDGELYISAADARAAFGRLAASRIDRIIEGCSQKTLINSKYRIHTVESLTLECRVIRMLRTVQARASLPPRDQPAILASGTILLCRRTVVIDGEKHWLVTDCGAVPETYLVQERELDGRFEAGSISGTAWDSRMQWFRERSASGHGLRRSDAADLKATMAVTADMCWSLRPIERRLFDLARTSGIGGRNACVTVFMCGRWLEQHPSDMEYLMDLGGSSVDIEWGLHSWLHPKAGGFMNDFSREQVLSDTLRLEQELLAWGIVPIVYYRFPGLIHDQQRLGAVLDMNLLPIDADAWIAVQGSSSEYGGPLANGSIVLVHGNGNEPRGINQFMDWIHANPGWAWADISRFLPR
jgi:hypothetical protein